MNLFYSWDKWTGNVKSIYTIKNTRLRNLYDSFMCKFFPSGIYCTEGVSQVILFTKLF